MSLGDLSSLDRTENVPILICSPRLTEELLIFRFHTSRNFTENIDTIKSRFDYCSFYWCWLFFVLFFVFPCVFSFIVKDWQYHTSINVKNVHCNRIELIHHKQTGGKTFTKFVTLPKSLKRRKKDLSVVEKRTTTDDQKNPFGKLLTFSPVLQV